MLKLAATGMNANHIATSLHLSYGTVRNYLSEAFTKLGAKIGWKRSVWLKRKAGCKMGCASSSDAIHGRTTYTKTWPLARAQNKTPPLREAF